MQRINIPFLAKFGIFASGLGIYYWYNTLKHSNKPKDKSANNTLFYKEPTDPDTREMLWREELKRNYEFFNEDGMHKIRNSIIIISGLDSFGSHCALTLIRSGIHKLIIIDNSILSESNYPKHPCAIIDDLGTKNSDLIIKYGTQINPSLLIECYDNWNSYIKSTTNHNIKPNYFIDCNTMNRITEKCRIVKHCKDNNIKCIMSWEPNIYQCDTTWVRLEKFTLVKSNTDTKKLNQEYNNWYQESIPDIITAYSIEPIRESVNVNKVNICIFPAFAQWVTSKVLCDLAEFREAEVKYVPKVKSNK